MTGASLLQDLGVLLVAGSTAALLLRPFRVPGVVAYIGAGLLLGPVTAVVDVTPGVQLISELGVALLLFLVGLEMSLERVRAVGRVAVQAGLAQMTLTTGAGIGIGLLAGLEPSVALVAGLAVSFSSTAVVVKLLDGAGELGAHHGQLALGILLVQDVVVILALTVLAGVAGADGGTAETVRRVGEALGGMAVLVGGAALAARFLLPTLFRRVASERETLFVWSLAWCFLFILAAEAFHLSVELGAFLAGLAVAQLPEAHDLGRRVAPLTSFFLAVFFVALGVELEPGAASGAVGVVAALALLATPGKGILVAWLLARLGEDEETAVRTGVVLSQTSEFSFILVGAAAVAGLTSPELTAVIGVVGLLTISLSSYGILESGWIHERLRRTGVLGVLGATGRRRGEGAGEISGGHVIVVGMNPLGRTLVRRLVEAGERVLAVDTDPRKLTGLPAPTLQGSVQDPAVLAEAGLQKARLLVSALRIEDVNELLAHRCRAAGVPASIHAFDPSVVERLLESGVDHLIFSRDQGTGRIAAGLRALGILG